MNEKCLLCNYLSSWNRKQLMLNVDITFAFDKKSVLNVHVFLIKYSEDEFDIIFTLQGNKMSRRDKQLQLEGFY